MTEGWNPLHQEQGMGLGQRFWVAGVVSIAGLALLLALSGCGEEKVEPLPPQQVIQKAIVAIQTPQTFHFTVDTAKMHKLPGLWLISAEGDAVKPDKLTAQVTARYNNYTFTSK